MRKILFFTLTICFIGLVSGSCDKDDKNIFANTTWKRVIPGGYEVFTFYDGGKYVKYIQDTYGTITSHYDTSNSYSYYIVDEGTSHILIYSKGSYEPTIYSYVGMPPHTIYYEVGGLHIVFAKQL